MPDDLQQQLADRVEAITHANARLFADAQSRYHFMLLVRAALTESNDSRSTKLIEVDILHGDDLDDSRSSDECSMGAHCIGPDCPRAYSHAQHGLPVSEQLAASKADEAAGRVVSGDDAIANLQERFANFDHPIVKGCTHAGPCTDRCEPRENGPDVTRGLQSDPSNPEAAEAIARDYNVNAALKIPRVASLDLREDGLKVQDEWMVRPSDYRRAGGAVPSVYLDELEARDWLAWQQSDERMGELREAAEAEQAAGFPEGNPATYCYAKHRERTWSLMHRQVTPWAKAPTVQPCGHPLTDLQSSDEGTSYCRGCQREAS